MDVKIIAEFEADFPDDSVEDDRGFVIWPGRGVAEALAATFESFGCRSTRPEHEHEHGWTLEVFVEKRRFWFQVTLIDEWVLVSEDLGGPTPKNGPTSHQQLLDLLSARLAEDDRFGEVRWFTREEYDRPSFPPQLSFDRSPGPPLPPTENVNVGLARITLMILLFFGGLGGAFLQVALATESTGRTSAQHLVLGLAFLCGAFLGAGWIAKQRWTWPRA